MFTPYKFVMASFPIHVKHIDSPVDVINPEKEGIRLINHRLILGYEVFHSPRQKVKKPTAEQMWASASD
jgi:hypothetical protein